ncbi:hypothetical protein CI109_106712 [Kwoniella shandongensis]|uniref:Uncharacterized protein n=1 Tax=Kwoniella shandongensis TaxID=1734106 RepID=A0AAJ8LS18_9TREE
MALQLEIDELLEGSPTESLFGPTTLPQLGDNNDAAADNWDPELGIGPEEVVAATVLALYSEDVTLAGRLARCAFDWARGLMEWTTNAPRGHQTIGEAIGILPRPRDLSELDMARFWLLCYHSDIDQNDLTLVHHARLVFILTSWYKETCQSPPQAGLTYSTDARLDSWHASMQSHGLDDSRTRLLDIAFHFAKTALHASHSRIWKDSMISGVLALEHAVKLLSRLSHWEPLDRLADLPPCYFSMATLAANVLVNSCHLQPTVVHDAGSWTEISKFRNTAGSSSIYVGYRKCFVNQL